MSKRKTTEEYKIELSKVNSNLVLLSDYVNCKTKVTVKDIRCGHIWDVNPNTPLHGHGCPKCAGVKKKTHQEFVNELKVINPNIEILSKYVNSSTKVKCRCKICNFEWVCVPYSLLAGRGCGKCYGKYLSDEEFEEKLQQIHPHIKLEGHYYGSHKPTYFICKIDGTVWKNTPHDVIRTKNGCPTCMSRDQSNRQYWTNDEYLEKVKKVCDYIVPIENYEGWNIQIHHKCKKCGYTWKISPTSILHNPHCPSCDGSKGERQIAKILEKYHVTYECQKKFYDLKHINSLRYDFYLPTLNTLIEYDGVYHYQPVINEELFAKGKIRDELKDNYALEHNINLIRIPYWDYKNIESILVKKLTL